MGAILRTSSENATEEDIKNDIKDLLEKWAEIEKKIDTAKSSVNISILLRF